MASSPRIAVIGGGITGLATAYHLERLTDGEIDLYEASPYLGGKLQTESVGGCLIEAGPDCFFCRKPAAMEMVKELGLTEELIEPSVSEFLMYVGGKLHPVPRRLVATSFSDPDAIAEVSFLNDPAKARALAEGEIPAGEGEDESIRSFFSRRFGPEFSRLLAEPLFAGTHGGDAGQLSLRALYPGFLQLEQTFGSLRASQSAVQPARAGKPSFVSFRNGMQTLPKGLREALQRTRIHLGVSVESLEAIPADWYFVTTPANRAAPLVPPAAHGLVASIPHVSSTDRDARISRRASSPRP